MGASPQSFHALDLKGMFLGNKGMSPCQSSDDGSLWSKVLKGQAMRMRQEGKQSTNVGGGHGWRRSRSRKRRMLMMKRKGSCGRPINGIGIGIGIGIGRRVRVLKKLVPNGRSKGLDGLFRDTADYIVCLQMRLKVMQMMLNLLSKTDE